MSKSQNYLQKSVDFNEELFIKSLGERTTKSSPKDQDVVVLSSDCFFLQDLGSKRSRSSSKNKENQQSCTNVKYLQDDKIEYTISRLKAKYFNNINNKSHPLVRKKVEVTGFRNQQKMSMTSKNIQKNRQQKNNVYSNSNSSLLLNSNVKVNSYMNVQQ